MYRTYDGQYGLVAANADGTDRVPLGGPNFAHPETIRFVESRNRRWAAWADGGEVRVAAALGNLGSATTLGTTSNTGTATVRALAISEDGQRVAYEVLTGDLGTMAADLYVAHVGDRSVTHLRTFAGPMIVCLANAAFDSTAQRLITVGCGSGMAAGLVLMNANDGSIISEDDTFGAWPGQWAYSADLGTVWLIADGHGENDVVRYETATRTRVVLYRSPVWYQSDGSAAPNLPGPVLLAPDETKVAFSRFPKDRALEVYELPSSGGNATMLAKDASISVLASWSPDGRYVAVWGAISPSQGMRLINAQTKDVAPVTTGPGVVEFLAWVVS